MNKYGANDPMSNIYQEAAETRAKTYNKEVQEIPNKTLKKKNRKVKTEHKQKEKESTSQEKNNY